MASKETSISHMLKAVGFLIPKQGFFFCFLKLCKNLYNIHRKYRFFKSQTLTA